MISASVLLFGLLFGLQHALEADHLAAVATLVARESDGRKVIRQGMFWGLGHSLTLLLFGGAVMVVGIALSDAWSHALEVAVGIMLVLLGADLLRRIWRDRIHFHAHLHPQPAAAPQAHFHAHSHRGDAQPHDPRRHQHRHQPIPLRALLIGMVHGLAGSAALALLTLHQVGSPSIGLLYIVLFGVGSIAGMAALSWAISVPMRLSANRLTRCHRLLNIGVALFSVALGVHVVAGQWPL